MKCLGNLVLAAAFLAGLWAGVTWLLTGAPGPLGSRALPRFLGELQEEEARSESLDARLRVTLQHLAAKDRVCREVSAGRLTLLEGAARVRAAPTGAPTS